MVKQVGGTHYEAEYQHWDWAADTRLGYLEGNATKYLGRHRKKNGKQDLEKALSYVEKMIQVKGLPGAGSRPGQDSVLLMRYIGAAGLGGSREARITILIDSWRHTADLFLIRSLIQEMIDDHD